MRCTICDEGITNPICIECLGKEIEQWLVETKPVLINDLKEIMAFYNSMGPISNCIICKRDMGVCRHCFTKEVFNLIQENNPKLEEDFLRQFNYELIGY